MTNEELLSHIKWLETGVEITTLCLNVVTDDFDAFVSHHIAGTVDKKVLMRARSMLPRRCANTLQREGK